MVTPSQYPTQVFTQSITLEISSRSGRLAAPGMTHPEAGLLPICEPVTLEELPVSETQQGDKHRSAVSISKEKIHKEERVRGSRASLKTHQPR